jgi:hypothetical protein
VAAVVAVGAAGGAAGGPINVRGDAADGTVDVNGLPGDFSLPQLRVGVGGDDVRGLAPVFFFSLPTLPSRDSLAGAELRLTFLDFTRGTPGNWEFPRYNVDLFGLGARATPTILNADYYDGDASLGTDALIAEGFATPATAPGTTLQVSGGGLLDFVRSLYNPDGTPVAAFAVFRANADVHLPPRFSRRYSGYELASGDNTDGGGAVAPQLRLTVVTVVPEPGTLTLSLLGAATLTGWRWRRRRSNTTNR